MDTLAQTHSLRLRRSRETSASTPQVAAAHNSRAHQAYLGEAFPSQRFYVLGRKSSKTSAWESHGSLTTSAEAHGTPSVPLSFPRSPPGAVSLNSPLSKRSSDARVAGVSFRPQQGQQTASTRSGPAPRSAAAARQGTGQPWEALSLVSLGHAQTQLASRFNLRY